MSNTKKKVYCLYRVSTIKQLEKEDIPMQRQVCREFADQQGWEILEEKVEKGVSGFKVSATDRDAIQELQNDALQGKFDILLVFMFDRLGRKDDETPFVVEWFVQNGIEVWSTQEGQQRFDNHVDKLMNYIRYWQASGESIKTSIRTKTRLGQIVQEGRFRGGTAAYGYKLVKEGRLNKKGYEVNEIAIDEEEAAVVKLVFHLYLNKGYGSKRICTQLEKLGFKTRKGSNFVNCTIQNMLKNDTYTGILKSGESRSEVFPDLQIIDPDTFEQVQEIMAQRSTAYKDRNIPLHTKGQGLLSGNLYCGHCGARLVQTSNISKVRNEDGSVRKEYKRIRYVCYNKTRHKGTCDGQTGYTVHKVDSIIDGVIREIFARAKDAPQGEILQPKYESRIKELETKRSAISRKVKKHGDAVDALKTEMINVIRGESALDRETISEMLAESKAALEEAEAELERCDLELEDGQEIRNEIMKAHDSLLSWADMYDQSELEDRKMIVAKIINKVSLSRDYKIEIDFAISYEDYFEGSSFTGKFAIA